MPVLQKLTRRIARATTFTTPGPDDQRVWSKHELLARLRGEQTIRRMRAQGLNAPDPFFIASHVSIDPGFAWAVQIGAHTTISANVQIIAHDSAMFHLTGYTLVRAVKIGVKCYIGAGTTILPGAVIGDGAIVGAGSVVNGEIPADTIAAGNPARVHGHIDEYRERHVAAMVDVPRFEKGPAERGGLAPYELIAMKRALVTHGCLYVR